MMKINEILNKYHKIEIELLLTHVLRKPKEFIFLHPGNNLTIKQFNNLQELIKRRQKGEPVAYILGYRDFMGLRFRVTRDVLIPRPETEGLVERVISYVEARRGVPSEDGLPRHAATGTLNILDLGTGSGCIIISLAKHLQNLTNVPNCKLFASDISAAALKVAKQNAKTIFGKKSDTLEYVRNLRFFKSDLFQNVQGKFDIIIANLPYIPLKILRKHLHHKNRVKNIFSIKSKNIFYSADDPFAALKYEPAFALTDGSNSWQIYRRFFEQVGNHLSPGGKIILEIDPASRKLLNEYQKKYLPTGQIKFYKDFNNFWRYAEIKRAK